MVQQVIQLSSARKKTPVRHESADISFANVYELTKFVAGEIRGSKMKFSKIADKAGCCASTVSNIAHGVTHDPRVGTVIKILGVLGYRVTARR
jgi:transcriptional regulator with XRE-family HTH domain